MLTRALALESRIADCLNRSQSGGARTEEVTGFDRQTLIEVYSRRNFDLPGQVNSLNKLEATEYDRYSFTIMHLQLFSFAIFKNEAKRQLVVVECRYTTTDPGD